MTGDKKQLYEVEHTNNFNYVDIARATLFKFKHNRVVVGIDELLFLK